MEFDISDSTTAEQLKQLLKTSNSILNNLPSSGSTANSSAVVSNNNDVVVGLSNLHAHQLVSTNSFEMNGGGTSISEDSGLPYTNSSVSSGDSIRCVGLCKLELEVSDNKYLANLNRQRTIIINSMHSFMFSHFSLIYLKYTKPNNYDV